MSLLLPLCKELDITVNELLSGARVSEEEYQKKAEENMVNMIKEREENKKKLIPTIITGLIATISFITLIMVVAVYTEVIAVPVKILLIVIACVIFGCGLMVAMEGERTIGYYKCRHCNELVCSDLWCIYNGNAYDFNKIFEMSKMWNKNLV